MSNLIKEFEEIQNKLLVEKEKNNKIPSDSEILLIEELVGNITNILLTDWVDEVCLLSLNQLNTDIYIKCRVYVKLYEIKAPPRKFATAFHAHTQVRCLAEHLDVRFALLMESFFNEKTENFDDPAKLRYIEKLFAEEKEMAFLGFSLDSESDFGELAEKFWTSMRIIKKELEEKIFNEKKDVLDLTDEFQDMDEVNNGDLPKFKEFTLRQKVLFLLLVTFNRLDIPDGLPKQRVVEFFYAITGGSIKNLQNILKEPTSHKGNEKSIKRLINDLNIVRDYLGKINLSDNVSKAINEIDFLIEELPDKN
jgi:hypothetical protein